MATIAQQSVLDLGELLYAHGLPRDARTKLVRHQDPRLDLRRIREVGQFDTYQALQSKPIFECRLIVSFIGTDYSHARMVGVYKVGGREGPGHFPLPADFLYPNLPAAAYRYKLDRVPGFEALEDRVVIDWGPSTRSWHQWLKRKEVVEILPANYTREFPGYYEFILSFADLCKIVENPTANREWNRMLRAVAGIYLITDERDGRQYVGSAYGDAGVWGRWAEYARTRHGGNVGLRELLDTNLSDARHFSFTLLRTLPKTMTRDEVFDVESLYKAKLGSRARGLNEN